MRLTLCVVACASIVGCGTAPTTAARPDKFERVHAARFDVSKQPVFMDCIFDGFLGAQNMALATHVRQVKRADGYRVDVIASAFQYVVADIHDDGTYELRRSSYASMVDLTAEEDASMACLKSFGATDIVLGPLATPASRRNQVTGADARLYPTGRK